MTFFSLVNNHAKKLAAKQTVMPRLQKKGTMVHLRRWEAKRQIQSYDEKGKIQWNPVRPKEQNA
jgi:hypothetical protein